jgi:hypothetical protein
MAGSTEELRVVLVKPGDVLLIGNIGGGLVDVIDWEAVRACFDKLGLKVVLFAEDIDLGLLPGGASGA